MTMTDTNEAAMTGGELDAQRRVEAAEAVERSSTRQHFTDVRHVTVRWEPYKPDGRRQMKALGRWQERVGSGDYWRWQNCERPAFAHDPDTAATMLRLLRARVGELEHERDEWRGRAQDRCGEAEKWFRKYGAEKARAERAEARETDHG